MNDAAAKSKRKSLELDDVLVPADAILGLGHAASGLGHAIRGLASLGLHSEAKELSEQLKFIAKNIQWYTTQHSLDRSSKNGTA